MVQRSNSPLAAFSHSVRTVTWVFFGSLALGLVVFTLASASMFGLSRDTKELRIASVDCVEANNYCAPINTRQLNDAIDRQKDLGFTCTAERALTEVILFQRSDDLSVDALSFDNAVNASAHKLGWVQRFCR